MNLSLKNIRLPIGDLDIHIDCRLNGKITAIFGSTGCGKTTLVEIIAGLRQPLTGKIALGARVLQDSENGIFLPPQTRNVGYVPQDLALFPHMTVGKNIEYGLRTRRTAPQKLIHEALELSPLLQRMPSTLYGGEKQRVALARALCANPDILLLDEPLSSLDDAIKQRIIPYLLRIRDEFQIPIVHVTHSGEEVMQFCDDAILIEAGKVQNQGPPHDLFVRSERAIYLPRGN